MLEDSPPSLNPKYHISIHSHDENGRNPQNVEIYPEGTYVKTWTQRDHVLEEEVELFKTLKYKNLVYSINKYARNSQNFFQGDLRQNMDPHGLFCQKVL